MNIIRKLRKASEFTAAGVAEYMGMGEQEYLLLEQAPVDSLDVRQLERLADLYHVEPYDILTGTAVSLTFSKSPAEETELIPFFRIISSYMKMVRLLERAKNEARTKE